MTAVTDRPPSPLRTVTGLHREPVDLDEPFVDVVRRFAHLPGTVALLSGGEQDSARYDVLGVDPWLTLTGHRERTTLVDGSRRTELDQDPFTALRGVLDRVHVPAQAGLPLAGGLLGYLAYDLKDCLEVLPRTSVDDLGLPLLHLVAPSVLLVRDRVAGTTTLVVMHLEDDDADAVDGRVARFTAALRAPAPPAGAVAATGPLTSTLSREEYLASVEAIRAYIVEGDVYQVNMSQRFTAPVTGDPFDCFAAMFAANPAPFFSYVNAGDHQIVSTSPERFLRLRDGEVETRPIKGTRPRGATPAQDAALRTELRESPKEDAELSMIVDLLRNDVARVCRPGSVRVTEHKRLETYENVHHLVSTVTGELRPGADAVDLLRATFPGGSITGCPKIRAMGVIDELEPVRRHVYTGSIGYVGFDGTMDLSIAIRTATFTGGRAVFSVGGGIVIDSEPASEYEETLHKGRTLMAALRADVTVEDRRTVWHDGRFVPAAAASVPFDSEGLAYGHGFFETLRVQGGRPVLLAAHVERFERTWRALFGGSPPDVTWADVVARLVERNGLARTTAVVKLVAAAGNAPGAPPAPTLFASARPYTPRPALSLHGGLRLRTYPHRRHTHLADHKTLNHLHYRLAGAWAQQHDADEAVILNADATVSETSTASLCGVYGTTVRFPASEHALPGTTAGEVRRLLPARGFVVEDRRLTVADLQAADQVLVMNALMGVVPAVSLDGTPLDRDPALSDALNAAVLG
ncbi:aminodeoxychorismate synthase component I [Cellulomonas dongxiuzhuiae]|uniref:aminodeoxychorismate synthase component I n=1 Tax=Cellulomonas dongxiuzhuiae TaxID=2819979 RepID=UPI001AAF0FC4|nr:aminodeoxychorismate synthase component I [Cellulomonas dongxiuzhuiae]MBO3089786.1 aminodeoxychorismate synthase component I [Cellulomonas dongxiuzhuiae]MBO3090027.1 aminodeoxychorismate synthase component I [Cellulomonas dongxiuzhuiae]